MIKLNKILNESQIGYYLRWKDWTDKPEYEEILSKLEAIKSCVQKYLDKDVVFRGFSRREKNKDLLYITDEDRFVKLGGSVAQETLSIFWNGLKKKFPKIKSSSPIFGTFWYGQTSFFGNPMIYISKELSTYQSTECKDLSSCLEEILRKKVGKEKIITYSNRGISIQGATILTGEDYDKASEELFMSLINSFKEINGKNDGNEYNDILMGDKEYWLLSVNWILGLPKWTQEKIFPNTGTIKIGYGMEKPNFVANMKYKDVHKIIDYTIKYMKWSKNNFKSWIKSKNK